MCKYNWRFATLKPLFYVKNKLEIPLEVKILRKSYSIITDIGLARIKTQII